MSFRPCLFKWDAASRTMNLVPRFANVALAQFVDQEEYPLEVREHRSSKSHAHLFACINEAWKNLRGETAEILRTPEHLRAWSLIAAGWFDETIIETPSRDAAMKMATFARKLDDFAEIKVVKHDGRWFLRMRTPKSMSRASMAKEEFDRCKRDILDIIAGTIEVSRKTLEQAGKTAGDDR